jgi:hypothetical protein
MTPASRDVPITEYVDLDTAGLLEELTCRTAQLVAIQVELAERVAHHHRVFWESYQQSEEQSAVGKLREAHRRCLPLTASDDGLVTYKGYANQIIARVDLLRTLVAARTGVAVDSHNFLHLDGVPNG